ncbi:MAG: sugar transferase [Pseudomonadota bacterium]
MKRLIDILCSAAGLAVLAPITILVAIAVFVSMGRPVFFRQQRPGLNAQPFELLKFRTMRPSLNQDAVSTDDDQRLTRTGSILRRLSLDEIPQLWNVLRGDMSLVGPRPLLMAYLPMYSDFQARRHEVRPGITGLAQVYGRNATTWERRFELDVRYVDTQSIWLDLKIMVRTVWIVVSRHGVSAEGHATMPPFYRDVRSSDGNSGE